MIYDKAAIISLRSMRNNFNIFLLHLQQHLNKLQSNELLYALQVTIYEFQPSSCHKISVDRYCNLEYKRTT